jgi:hypothetical protein
VRRRFGRRRKSTAAGEGKPAALDAARWLTRIVEDGVVAARELTPTDPVEIPENFAVVGVGEAQDGSRLVVAFAPDGGNAALASLAVASRLKEESNFEGEVVAVAPEWSGAARRRLGLIGELPFGFRALGSSSFVDGAAAVEAEACGEPDLFSSQQLAAHIERSDDRELFLRAAAALEGLASKHGGVLRIAGRSVELVLLARRVAELRVEEQGSVLQVHAPQKSTTRLSLDELAGALDQLEGQLRRRLNDRRVRDGEEGLRTRVIPLVVTAQALRTVVRWPLGGSDAETLDLIGVDATGQTYVGAVRESMALPDLAAVLDEALRVRASLPTRLAHAGPPLRLGAPRLLLAAERFDAAVRRVLPLLSQGHDLLEIRSGRDREYRVASLQAGEAATTQREGTAAEAGGQGGRGRPRRRGGRRRGGRRDGTTEGTPVASGARKESSEAQTPRFEEMSFFDLEEEGRAPNRSSSRESAGPRARTGGRSRGRRRGRARGPSEESDDGEQSDGRPELASEVDEGELDGTSMLSEPISELEGVDEVVPPSYDDDDEVDGESDPQQDRLAIEREKRRLARLPASAPEAEEPQPERKAPRRRAAVVVHADHDSVLAAVLLARDLRLLQGIWVYPQSELMNFFRGPAIDLSEQAPIHVVGFTPSPAREVIQAASLYQDRLHWYDHRSWPPEDLEGLRNAVGREAVHVTPGTRSTLPAVLAMCTRRSRFSDKLVELATARFSQHDYERWGRLWWWRLTEVASKPGERRADLEGLLIGRPSELAKEASTAAVPPLPDELGYVSRRDFRLVHFSGFSMVVVDAPPECDLHLCARIARERYGASLSLVMVPGDDLLILAGDEQNGRRSLDFGGLVEHLVSKLDWAEAMPDEDHVARFRVRDLASHPERLDEVIGEIAMGGSILEG